MNSIILHGVNSTEVTPEELQAVRTPEPSATWTPIPHAALIESVKREITMGDLAIAWERIHRLWSRKEALSLLPRPRDRTLLRQPRAAFLRTPRCPQANPPGETSGRL